MRQYSPSSNGDESFDIMRSSLLKSSKQSSYYSEDNQEIEESLSKMIQRKRQQLMSGVKQLEQNDATFDLSDTMHEYKTKTLQDSTLESRIQKLEQELNTSLKSTKKKNDPSVSMTSVDSFSIDIGRRGQDILPNYEKRLNSLRNQEPEIDWKSNNSSYSENRKLENFDYEIQSLHEELDKLKEEIAQDDQTQRRTRIKLKEQLRQHTHETDSDHEYHHKIPKFKKKKENSIIDNVNNDSFNSNLNKSKTQRQSDILIEHNDNDPRSLPIFPNSTIAQEIKQTETSLDIIPQKQLNKERETTKESIKVIVKETKENQKPPENVNRLYKLNREMDVLKQIERIRSKLKKTIKQKIETEKVIEIYDPSFNLPSKTKIVNKSAKQHCPNCTYLLNRGMSTAFCSCN